MKALSKLHFPAVLPSGKNHSTSGPLREETNILPNPGFEARVINPTTLSLYQLHKPIFIPSPAKLQIYIRAPYFGLKTVA